MSNTLEMEAVAGAAGGTATLVTENVSAWFGEHKVLDRVSLEMRANQVRLETDCLLKQVGTFWKSFLLKSD